MPSTSSPAGPLSSSSSRAASPHSRALPRLLCLHGGGTSALIFRIQLRNLTHALSPHFNFIFVDAPYTSEAGPGVLPVFADCAPFYRWMPIEDYTSKGPEAGVKQQVAAAEESRRRIVRAVEEDTEAGNIGEVVGVLGFSQGGRLTAGLLADQHDDNVWPDMPDFKFGLLLCASYPPYSRANAAKSPLDWSGPKDEHGVLKEPGEAEIMTAPSIHVRGTLDPHLEKGRRLGKYFSDGGIKEVKEFKMAHNLPQAAGDATSGGQASTNEIRDAVLKVWGQCQSHSNGQTE